MKDKDEARAALRMFMETADIMLEVEQSAFDKVTEYDIEYQVVLDDGSVIDADDKEHAREIAALVPCVKKIQSRMVYLASWEDEPSE